MLSSVVLQAPLKGSEEQLKQAFLHRGKRQLA